jgi:hypothetical protein
LAARSGGTGLAKDSAFSAVFGVSIRSKYSVLEVLSLVLRLLELVSLYFGSWCRISVVMLVRVQVRRDLSDTVRHHDPELGLADADAEAVLLDRLG